MNEHGQGQLQPKPTERFAAQQACAATESRPPLPLNEGIAHLHGLCLAFRSRLDTLSRHVENAAVPESVKGDPASSMQDQLMAAIDAMGEAGTLLDGLAATMGYQL